MLKKNYRNILNHLLIWTIYILFWSVRDLAYHESFFENIYSNLFFNISIVPFIYFNLYVLVPNYLFPRKKAKYILYLSLGLVGIFLTRYFSYSFFFEYVAHNEEAVEKFQSVAGIGILATENILIVFLSMAIFFLQQWYVKERYARELEQKNVESELSMLKAQLQPHFLFNNLNTIYFLMESNPQLAKEVMIQFSDVLSHQLYNAKKDKVPLNEELDYLRNYLKIQQVRHADFLDLEYHIPELGGPYEIAPMILLTFIENAFKHGQSDSGYNIFLSLQVQENGELWLQLSNTLGTQDPLMKGGVGLQNVRRRLELLYPEKHRLTINKTSITYDVELILTLDPL